MAGTFTNLAPIKRSQGLIGALQAFAGCIRERRWVCLRGHLLDYSLDAVLRPRECGSFREWLFCQVWAHATPWLRDWLIETGFVDSLTDGGLAFWRWDPWNAHMRAELKRIEREATGPNDLHGYDG
jgi:hypothetical protein